MKVLLFLPYYYSLKSSLMRGFEENNCEVFSSSFDELHQKFVRDINIKTVGLPLRYRKYWDKWLIDSSQEKYLALYEKFKPEIIIIYNNEHFQPKTIEKLKKHSKIIFLLGDNPLLSKTDLNNLTILEEADYIVCPDSYWKEQLELIGIKNIVTDYIGTDNKVYYPLPNSKYQESSKISFIGRTYRNADGYKRAKFLSKFSLRFLANIFSKVLGIITLPIIASVFGPDLFGSWNLVLVILGYVSILTNFGFVPYGIREIAKKESEHVVIVNNILSARLALSILAMFLSTIIIYFIDDRESIFIFAVIIGYISIFANAINLEFYFLGKKKYS